MLATDWNMVGALGQWAGAIATFLAVVVALKTVHDASTIRVDVTAAPGITTPDGRDAVILTAVNKSHRPVTQTTFGLILPSRKQLVFMDLANRNFPAKLAELDALTIPIPAVQLAAEMAKLGLTAECTLSVFFNDSTDTRHWVKFPFDPIMWLG
jgi:hypothetical protein